MSVIVTEIDIPKTCYRCQFYQEDDQLPDYCSISYDEIWHGEKEKLKDCPLKSVEGLIDAIHKKANSKQWGQWNEAIIFGMDLAVKVIKDYCEVSE